jgi:glycosyltransferase involved in cell wall biosynthesis
MDETARALVDAGESVRVLTHGRGKAVRAFDRAHPARITRLPGHHWKKNADLYLRLFLPWIGRRERGAAVHAATWEVAPRVAQLAPRYGWKLIVHAQGREIARVFGSHSEASAERRRLAAVLALADLVLPISRYVFELVVRAGADEASTRVIAPAIEAERVQGGDGDAFRRAYGLGRRSVILTLARLVERKGQDAVIRALPRIVSEVPDAVYVVAGSGCDRERLEAIAREVGMPERVVFAGSIPESRVPDAYAAADVYTMVSREGSSPGDIEGFGITYLEAGATGTPVVAGCSAGARDAVDESCGVFVNPEYTDEIADALVRLLRDPELARRLGAAGRQRVESRFSLPARAAKIKDAARSLVDAG